jgi:hypothetical protein
VGAVAFSRTGDPATGEFGDAKVIKKIRRSARRFEYVVEERTMAEDEETATARYIASNVSTQLMLKTMFEIIAAMADDPDGYRSDMRTKLLEIADTMPLAPMARGARKEGPCLRQGDGRQSLDQPAAQLVAAGAITENLWAVTGNLSRKVAYQFLGAVSPSSRALRWRQEILHCTGPKPACAT